jgi:thymidylate synthase (FAD)
MSASSESLTISASAVGGADIGDKKDGPAAAAEKSAPLPAIDKPVYMDVILENESLNEIKILDHGFVRLIDCTPRVVRTDSLGVESRIIDAARVCYGAGTKKFREDLALLSYLYRHEHMTPFEMVDLTFVASVPMFVAKQLVRHRAASYNEESARYSVIKDVCYRPTEQEVRAQSTTNRQGSDDSKTLSDDDSYAFVGMVELTYAGAFRAYDSAVKKGVAREMARIVLPEGRYTKFYFKMNLRNLLHFLELRMDSHAQKEMQEFAKAVYTLTRRIAPHAISVFDIYTRGAVKFSAYELDALSEILKGKPPTIPPSLSKGEKEDLLRKLDMLRARTV